MRIVRDPSPRAWDRFVAGSPGGTIFQSAPWTDLRPLCGWQVRRLAVEDRSGEILAGAAVGRRRALGRARSVLYAQRGPVFRAGEVAAVELLLEALATEARAERAVFVKLNPDAPAEDEDLSALLAAGGYRRVTAGAYAHGTTRRIDLTRPLDQIRAGFEGRTRRAIDKGRRDGVTVGSGIEPDRADCFVRLLVGAARRQGFPAPPRAFLLAAIDRLGRAGLCRVFTAEHEGEVLASNVALRFGGRATYMWGARSPEARSHRTNPAEMLQWEMITWAREQGCQEYDLQGAPEDVKKGDPLWGLHLFKRGFGGQVVRLLGEFDRVHAPVAYRAWTMVEPAYLWWKARRRAA